MVHGRDRNSELIVSSHPAVLDGFINVFRRDVLAREKEADIFIQKELQEMKTDTLGQSDQRAGMEIETGSLGHTDQKVEIEPETDTLGHDANPSATQKDLKSGVEMPQNETVDTLGQNENHSIIQNDLRQELEDIDDGDEIIDLGDETEQVLADMKKFLEDSGDTFGHSDQKQEQTDPEKAGEKELAFQIADRYIRIQETEGGYDYSIMGMDYKQIDGGVYDNKSNEVGFDINIRDALNNIVEDLKENPFDNGARGNIGDNDELIPIDYDGLMEKVEEANRIVPENFAGEYRGKF